MVDRGRAPHILIVRMSSYGDILHTALAVQLLRRWQPEARISWLVHAPFDRLVRRIQGIDRVLVVPRTGLRLLRPARRQLRDLHIDLALDFQGLLKSGFWAWASRAPRRLGFARRHLREPLARFFYNQTLDPDRDPGRARLVEAVRAPQAHPGLRFSSPEHVILKYTTLVLAAGVPPAFAVQQWTTRVDLAPSSAAADRVRQWRSHQMGDTTPYLLFYLGSAWPTKRWPLHRWAELVRRLTAATGWPVVLGWGPGEAAWAQAVAHQAGDRAHPIPAWGWDELLALVENAALVVGYDTGVTHLACARDRPVVFLMGATRPNRNGPWRFDRQKAVYHPPPCGPCYRRTCPFEVECMASITVTEVADLCLQLLEPACA